MYLHVQSLSLLGAILRKLMDADESLAPLHLLAWAVETLTTTLTCVVVNETSEELSAEQLGSLRGLYYPYMAIRKSHSARSIMHCEDMGWLSRVNE